MKDIYEIEHNLSYHMGIQNYGNLTLFDATIKMKQYDIEYEKKYLQQKAQNEKLKNSRR